jgi:hypothetical protein
MVEVPSRSRATPERRHRRVGRGELAPGHRRPKGRADRVGDPRAEARRPPGGYGGVPGSRDYGQPGSAGNRDYGQPSRTRPGALCDGLPPFHDHAGRFLTTEARNSRNGCLTVEAAPANEPATFPSGSSQPATANRDSQWGFLTGTPTGDGRTAVSPVGVCLPPLSSSTLSLPSRWDR